jgi:hypothetical protein
MVVVLGQCHDVTLGGDLQTAAPRHLNVGTFKLRNETSITRKNCHMETIAMRVPDENIASVRNVDTVRKVGYTFATNSSQEMTFVAKNHHIVTLKVANIKFLAWKKMFFTIFLTF